MATTQLRKKTAVADASRSNIYNVYPETLVLVTDKDHPLYHKKVHLPVSEKMVKSIIAKGVIQPIIVRKNGTDLEVVAGRQRTKNAVEANKRMVAEGGTAIRVPIIIRNESDAESAGTNVVTNEIQQAEDVVEKAAHANFLRKRFGKTDAELAEDYGVILNTIKVWAKLDELCKEVQEAIRRGEISFTVAVDNLADVKREEQVAAMQKLIASAPQRRIVGGEGGGSEGGGGGKAESPISRLRRLYRDEDAMGALTPREKTLLDWVFGQATSGDLLTSNGRLSAFINSEKKPAKADKKPGKKAA